MKAITLFTIILTFFILVYIAYYLCRRVKKEVFRNLDEKSAVILKTHIWNEDLERFAIKIKNESTQNGLDFYLLMQCESEANFNSIRDDELKKHVLKFTEAEIKQMYSRGFYSMWLSNHWIMMWFYQTHNKYKYIWSIEYDVRISGDSSKLWRYRGTEDFLYPIVPFQDPNWAYKNHYVGGVLIDKTKYYGYLQLARYSDTFLNYLHEHFSKGENGQDEMMIFSLFKRGKFSGSHDLLSSAINNTWSVFAHDSEKHKKLLEESDSEYNSNKNHFRIFHPVK